MLFCVTDEETGYEALYVGGDLKFVTDALADE